MARKQRFAADIPDALWNSFRPTPTRWWRSALVLVALLGIPFAGWGVASSGVLRPNLEINEAAGSSWQYNDQTQLLTVNWQIENKGAVRVSIESIELPEMTIIDPVSVDIGRGGSVSFAQTYQVTDLDCAGRDIPVVHYRNWSGSHAWTSRHGSIDFCEFVRTLPAN